jgi:SAM-dependent methyltransferase
MLKRYQEHDYFTSSVPGQGYDEYMDLRHNWNRTFARRLGQILKYRPAGRVLDVGCGPGFFLEAAAGMGYEVWGIDPSSYIVGVANQTFDGRVRHGTIHTVEFEPHSFDVVVAFDTFEHIYQPIAFLDAVRERLKPGGLFALTTPDPTSLLARLSGRRWVSFKIPEHVFYWSRATLARAMEGRFKILEATRAGQYATLGFLTRRLLGIGTTVPGALKPVLDALNRMSVYTDNGSVTVVAARL